MQSKSFLLYLDQVFSVTRGQRRKWTWRLGSVSLPKTAALVMRTMTFSPHEFGPKYGWKVPFLPALLFRNDHTRYFSFMTCLWVVLFLCLLFNYSWPFSFILVDSQAVVWYCLLTPFIHFASIFLSFQFFNIIYDFFHIEVIKFS